MLKKRGLSDVVVLVLLLLLVLAGVVILWSFARAFIFDSSGQVETGVFTSSFSIPASNVVITGANDVQFKVVRNAGEGRLKALTVVLEDVNKNRWTRRYDTELKELESIILPTDTISIGSGVHGLGEIKKISIAPVILNKDGKEIQAGIAATYKVKGGEGTTPVDNDGLGGSCDSGDLCNAGLLCINNICSCDGAEDCSDNNVCTSDVCNANACVNNADPSQVGNSCTINGNPGTCNAAGQCVAQQQCPNTCASLGYQCGTQPDGCGGTINCGSCPSGSCNAQGQCTLATSASDWIMFGKNAQHTTYMELDSDIISLNNFVCSQTEKSFSMPLLVGNDIILYNNDDDKLEVRGVGTCGTVSQFSTISSSITISDGTSNNRLYYNKRRVYAFDNGASDHLYSWNLDSLTTAPQSVLVSNLGTNPVLYNDHLYYIGSDNKLYSYHANNDPNNLQIDNSQSSATALSGVSGCAGDPVIENGVLYATCNSRRNIVAYSISSGLLWIKDYSTNTGSSSIEQISVENGKICVPYSDSNAGAFIVSTTDGVIIPGTNHPWIQASINNPDQGAFPVFTTMHNEICYMDYQLGKYNTITTKILVAVNSVNGQIVRIDGGSDLGFRPYNPSYFFPVKTNGGAVYGAGGNPNNYISGYPGVVYKVNYDLNGMPSGNIVDSVNLDNVRNWRSFAVHKGGKIVITAEGSSGVGKGLFVYGNL